MTRSGLNRAACWLLLATLTLAITACGKSPPDPATWVDADGLTAEQTFRKLITAAQRGDIETYAGLLGGMSAAKWRFMRTHEAFDLACEIRFPEYHALMGWNPFNPESADGSPTPCLEDSIRDRYSRWKAYEVKEAGAIGPDRVLLTILITTESTPFFQVTWLALLENDRWKLVTPGKGVESEAVHQGPDGNTIKIPALVSGIAEDRSWLIRSIQRETDFYQRLTEEIHAGRFRSYLNVMFVEDEFKFKRTER
jgi:hypothetical protein